MPTVGWIREGDLEAFYEGAESMPDPSSGNQPRLSSHFCASVFSLQSEIHDHVYPKYRIERPIIIMRGKEPNAHSVVRSSLAPSELAVANTRSVRSVHGGEGGTVIMNHVIVREETGCRLVVGFGEVEIMMPLHINFAVNGQQRTNGDDFGQ